LASKSASNGDEYRKNGGGIYLGVRDVSYGVRPSNLTLDGLRALTDEVGMFQHKKFSIIARKEGYTTDDNTRALIAALMHHRNFGDPDSLQLAETYISFILHMQREDGRFHNLMGFDRRFRDEIGSEDCMGHALWACGYTLNVDAPEEMRLVAKEIFDRCLPPSRLFTSPRAKALTILGLHHYQRAFPDDRNPSRHIKKLTGELITQYGVEADAEWRWFESYLTYANARLPQALLAAHLSLGEPSSLKIALDSLDFLVETHIADGVFMPIGTEGWYIKGGERAVYDQQPIEASCMVEAAVLAYVITGENEYLETAKTAYEWYHGGNTLGVVLVNGVTGTCYDGITPEGLNRNQGAEATLSYYLAYLTMLENDLL
jgi:hypothetical protein